MKILIVSHKFYPDIGGIEAISEMLANAFYKDKHEIRLITWTKAEGEKKFPFKILRNPSSFSAVKQMRWADIIFENNPCIRLTWPNLLLRRPIVTGLQTWIAKLDGSEGIHEKLKKAWISLSDGLIACSQAIKMKTSERAVVIGNPYNDKLFYRRSEIPKNKDFIFLGRLVSDKGASLAVEALAIINEKLPTGEKSNLTIVGDGLERKNLEKMVVEKGLQNAVTFTGSMSGEPLVEQLNRHKFLLVPSLWNEPFGIVALEGMACGCIPIVSDGGGLPDAVGKAGMVFKKGDAADLASCMLKLKKDGGLITPYLEAAPHHLQAHRYERTAREYLEVFEKATKR